MRILIVEDEITLCEQIHQYLADKGFAVDTANTGSDGYYMVRSTRLMPLLLILVFPIFQASNSLNAYAKLK